MRDLDLTTLRLFVLVCEARSITRAAAQAHIVGSAVSKRLAQLEETVGVPLLLRRRRGVEPTPAGETLLEHARSMLAGAQRIVHDMGAYASGLKGQVRILASVSVIAEALADDIAGFMQVPAHRQIQVDIEERISPEVVRGVREGSAALGICWDAAELDGLAWRPYRSDRLALAVHPSHPLAARRRLRFEQALDNDFVSLPAASAVQRMLQRVAAQFGRTMNHRVTVSGFEAALRVVRANLAVSVVPIEVVNPLSLGQDLRLIPLSDDWARRRFVICYRDQQQLPRAAQLLLDHLSKLG
jgi:DNA-binding transcriptional LysR family regulator